MRKKRGVASLWRRVIAYFIDVLIISVVVVYPFRKHFGEIFSFNLSLSGDILIAMTVMSILTVFYWAVLEYSMRQSIGKMMMGIYVNAGKKATLWQFVLRNLPKVSSYNSHFLIALDTLYMIFTKQHQRYFEKLSKTEVLEVPKIK